MAIEIYNVTQDLRQTLTDYLNALNLVDFEAGGELEDTYRIVLFYQKSALFEAVKKRTALRGKNVRDNEGNSQLDRIAMTTDEQSIFNDAIFHAASNVFKILSGYARDTEFAFKFDELVDTELSIIFYLDLDETIDTNYIKLLDPEVEKAMIWYVIRDWYEIIGFEDYALANMNYENALAEVKSRSNYLQRNVTRPTPLF